MKEGIYIVEADRKRTVAEYHGDGVWTQLGADYDLWADFGRGATPVKIIARIDVDLGKVEDA